MQRSGGQSNKGAPAGRSFLSNRTAGVPNRWAEEEQPPTEGAIRKQAKAAKLNAALAQALTKSQDTTNTKAPEKKKKKKQVVAADAAATTTQEDDEEGGVSVFHGKYADPHAPVAEGTTLDGAANLDEYGKGNPFDRLQFGYSPAVHAEAVAYHQPFVAKDWISQRKKFYTMAIIKKQKLHKANCEPLVTMFKLKKHWQSLSKFDAALKADAVDDDMAEQFLELLAKEQQQQQPGASSATAANSVTRGNGKNGGVVVGGGEQKTTRARSSTDDDGDDNIAEKPVTRGSKKHRAEKAKTTEEGEG